MRWSGAGYSSFACGINKVYHVSTLASLFPQCSLRGATVAANLDSGSGPAEHSAVWAGLWPYGRWIHGYMVSTVTEANLERAVFHARKEKNKTKKNIWCYRTKWILLCSLSLRLVLFEICLWWLGAKYSSFSVCFILGLCFLNTHKTNIEILKEN